MEPRLAFENVDKRYGRVLALDALSLSVEPGEIFGFLGPNGAGKSTAIHVAMGFLQPSSGRGTLLGLPFGRARAARSRTGYVPDAPAFFAGSPLAAVLAAAELNSEGKPLRGLREHARELLRMLDLPGSDDTSKARDARKLSRGQQQRLAIAQALITRPDLLVLDEPTSALDPPAVLLVREVLEQARDRGAAVFFSSHQLQEVELLCDRAAFLDEGRLLQSGTMAELLQEGTLAHITLRGLTRESPFVRHNVAKLQDSTLGRGMRASMRGDLVFAVPVPEQQRFLEHAWVAGAELVALSRTRRTLEQLFAQRRQRAPEQRLEQEG